MRFGTAFIMSMYTLRIKYALLFTIHGNVLLVNYRMSYQEAIEVLKRSQERFEFKPEVRKLELSLNSNIYNCTPLLCTLYGDTRRNEICQI